MKFSPNLNLPCLDVEDYAAYALYLQCLATQLDDKFQEQFEAIDAFLRPPASVWTRTTTQTGLGTPDPQVLFIFEIETQVNWPFLLTTNPNIPNIRGWWHVGLTGNFIASGGVTNDSERQLALRGDAVINELGTVTVDYVNLLEEVHESNTGNGENLTVQGTVFQPGFDEIILRGYLTNANVASSLTMTTTPQPRLWVTFLGDTPEIEQVT